MIHTNLKLTINAPKDAETRFARLYDDEMDEATRRSAEVMLETVRQEIINRDMVAEGDLLDSVEVLDIDISTDNKLAAVGSEDRAATAAEYGTVPAANGISIDVQPIREWMAAKGINATYGTDEQFAHAIAAAIGRNGLPLKRGGGGKGVETSGLKRPFNAAQKKAKRKVDKIWADAVANAMVRVSNGR